MSDIMIKMIEGTASILAVGTELTTGQVTNRNAAWIAEKLVNLGVEVILHETIADDRDRIEAALEHCANLSQLIFVTGGLGPTTDDFTRDVIASWLKQDLQFDAPSWDRIVTRLNQFGIPIADSNRQQCYFPKGAQIIPNPDGTASGFTLALPENHQQLWAFPGPPREVAAVWSQGVESLILEKCKRLRPTHLYTWQCIGKSEAELGEITEKALAGSGLQTGYRAHRPFVEVKVWCPPTEIDEKAIWIQKLEDTIRPWVLTRQGEDLAVRLLHHLYRNEIVEIFDAASGGLLASRMGQLLHQSQFKKQAEKITIATEWAPVDAPENWISRILDQADDTAITLAFAGFTSDGRSALGLRHDSKVYQDSIQSPYRNPELIDRSRAYSLEFALKKWCDWLEGSIH
jgi:molybdenum cofactor synthesis domain-containing protein